MAGKSLNRVQLIGNLGKDPEIKYTPQGTPVAKVTIATNERFKDKSGEWKEKPEWHRVTIWGEGSIKHLEKHGKKGALIDVLGQNRTRKWTTGDVDHYSTEVVCDFRAGGEVKVTSLAKAAKEQPEPGEGDHEPAEDQAA